MGKRVFLIFLLLSMVFILTSCGGTNNSRTLESFDFMGKNFMLTTSEKNSWTYHSADGEEISFEAFTNRITIHHLDKVMTYNFSNDGTSTFAGNLDDPLHVFDYMDLASDIRFSNANMSRSSGNRTNGGYIFLSFILIGLGLLNVLKPDLVFYLSEGWKFSNDVEPSLLYKEITIVAGVIGIIAGIVIFFMAI